MSKVVIRLTGGEGILRRDDGEIVLTHDVALESGQRLQSWDRYQPIRLGLSGERMLFGGLLPPGAVSVELVEATGGRRPASVAEGAFAVILDEKEHGEPALGYRNAAGAFVHRPMPAEYPHQPVTDAQEPCPVCDEVDYEQYFPTEEWRAGRGRKGTDSFVPGPLIVCRVCGHQHSMGGIIRCRGSESPDEDEAAREARLARIRAEYAVQRWYANKMTLMGVSFPIYAAEGWPAQINGQTSRGDDLTSLTVVHAPTLSDAMSIGRPQLQVTTSVDRCQPSDLTTARSAYQSLIDADGHRTPADELSEAAVALWFRARERQRTAASHRAPVSQTTIRIDGTPEAFLVVGVLDARWVAVRRHYDATITIAARDVDPAPLIIEPIADPSSRLLGPQPTEP